MHRAGRSCWDGPSPSVYERLERTYELPDLQAEIDCPAAARDMSSTGTGSQVPFRIVCAWIAERSPPLSFDRRGDQRNTGAFVTGVIGYNGRVAAVCTDQRGRSSRSRESRKTTPRSDCSRDSHRIERGCFRRGPGAPGWFASITRTKPGRPPSGDASQSPAAFEVVGTAKDNGMLKLRLPR